MKTSESTEWEKILDRTGEVHSVNKNAELTEKDFEEISVIKQKQTPWKEEYIEHGLMKEDIEREYFSLTFLIKKGLSDKIKNAFVKNDKKEMGIIKDNRVAFHFIVLSSIRQDSFTFPRIKKRDIKYFLRGMEKRKELEN